MIITRTPYRLSFFGGGSDYPEHYLKHGGAVLATSINKYCYITTRTLPPFFDHSFRVVYSKIELASSPKDIKHPSVKEVLKYLNVEEGLEIQHQGDLPARSGIGSSSSFTAGLLHSVLALRGQMISKFDLAMKTIHVEQNLIGEKVGSQDQVTASVGGFNVLRFQRDGSIVVNPLIISEARRLQLNDHLLMFFTGISRDSQTITRNKIEKIKLNPASINEMSQLVEDALSILKSDRDLTDFGILLHETWKLKRAIADDISNQRVDSIYDAALKNGAIGGKLLGAGGGGFIVFFAPPDTHSNIICALEKYVHVPFRFERQGSTVCLYEPGGFGNESI